ncbi:MAG: TIM barrel protein [bacterium]|nr:TIM barrel protein [bacterium]
MTLKGWFLKKEGEEKMLIRKYELGTAFSVGVWNIGPGGSRFSAPTRSELTMGEKLHLLKGAGATHIEAHNTDIAGIGAKAFAKLLAEEGLGWGMYTPNLFSGRPEYATGALDSPIQEVRHMAINDFIDVVNVAVEYDVDLVVFWNGMAGYNMTMEKDHVTHLGYLRDGLSEVVEWTRSRHGRKARRIAIEPKPNEPRNYMYLGTVGDALALIATLPREISRYLGVNPETAHSIMAGLDYCQDISLAMLSDKLFHVHLNDQNGPRYDQDYGFGDINVAKAFETVSLLVEHKYTGLVGFDVQPLPSDTDEQQVATVERSIQTFKDLLGLWTCMDIGDKNKLQELRAKGDAHGVCNWLTVRLYA